MRSKKHLDGARDQACINCGVRNDTVVACHYTGMRSALLGKGTGIKASDMAIADLCRKCHAAFDSSATTVDSSSVGKFAEKIDRSEQFLYLIVKTLIRREQQGLIEIGRKKDG